MEIELYPPVLKGLKFLGISSKARRSSPPSLSSERSLGLNDTAFEMSSPAPSAELVSFFLLPPHAASKPTVPSATAPVSRVRRLIDMFVIESPSVRSRARHLLATLSLSSLRTQIA